MRGIRLGLVIGAALLALPQGQTRPAGDYPIKPVPLADVRVDDEFWAPRMALNRAVTIPHIMRQNEETGRVANFLRAAGKLAGPFAGRRYNDTDVYKVIEAASYSLAVSRDPALERRLDELVAAIAAAQEPDGYIYPARTVDPKNPAAGAGPARWSYLHTSHELYNAGHLYEAAVAHFHATGQRTLLDIAIRNADLVCRTFGPGRRLDAPGHQEIELALVKLYRVTGDRKYLEQARFFLEQRGREHTTPPHRFEEKDPFAIYNDLAYRQDHQPVVDQTRATGHAVRATYMYAGMTDVATLLGEAAYARTLETLFQDVMSKRAYLTGGLGSQGRTEAFGDDYQLPNGRAYAETCASIGGILWYHRMFLRSGDGAFLDAFERTLYNGYLSGVSASGDRFFYQNPLESDGTRERTPYFDVACCPANLARLMAELPSLVYSTRADAVYVNLFVGSSASANVAGQRVAIRQQTRFPWDGAIRIAFDPERPAQFAVNVRVPGWARNQAWPGELYRFAAPITDAPGVTVNGERVAADVAHGFVAIRRRWQRGDVVEVVLPMPPRRVLAHERVQENFGKAAIARGPLVYAVEAVDNGGRALDLVVPLDARLEHEFRKELLGGLEVITARVPGTRGETRTVTAIPYFAWANRGKGQMAVWLPVE
ncbi:MAG TPA: beta-L-arabinofuranosidase domain-containing protein [Vicinamibacterales bacterium]|nr:beta-L-arabinofuranosidase domain-containing protein [Vicinamibacterales bacterium]